MKLICDFSFVNDYAENFLSDEERGSATIINSAITPSLKDNPILVISCQTMDELYKIYGDRELMLETVFDLCEKSDIPLCDRIDNLVKTAAIYELKDKDTYVLSDDDYIIKEINKTTHKAVTIKEALVLLKSKNLLSQITPLSEITTKAKE